MGHVIDSVKSAKIALYSSLTFSTSQKKQPRKLSSSEVPKGMGKESWASGWLRVSKNKSEKVYFNASAKDLVAD